MNASTLSTIRAGLFVLAAAASSDGWYVSGHAKASAMAVAALQGTVPAFLIAGRGAIAGNSMDADIFKDSAVPELKIAERPEHYIDLERLNGHAVPNDRRAYEALCGAIGVDPWQAGFLPYAIMEWNQRLTIALAEFRAWPDDRAVQAKCLVYAGMMAHYAGDLIQPLHVTIHYNGRKMPNGSVQFAGIHGRIDGLLTTIPDSVLPPNLVPHAFPMLADSVRATLRRSSSLVDTVYRLAGSDSREAWNRFALERLDATALFIADLILTAWEKSAAITLPDWDARDGRPPRVKGNHEPAKEPN